MARIYGDQINQYLQLKQGGLTPKRGILGDILVGLTDPFGKLGRSTRGIQELETAKAYGKGKEYRPDFMTNEEYERWKKSPGLEALKGGVGVASYFVPGAGALGGGLKGTLATGALSGGAYGFGASAPGEELESTLKSAVMGAGTAGALYGAGKGIQRLKEGGARGRLKSKGLLGGAGDANMKGSASRSKLDFNQAYNQYDEIAGTLTPEEQAQTLLDIKKISPKGYREAADMQIQTRTQRNAPLAQEVNRLSGKGIGKYTARYDPNSPKTMAEQFDDALTGKSPVGQNTLQKKTIVGQYKQMGLTTRKGALDYVDEFNKSTNKLEQAREFFGLPRTDEGMSQLPRKIGGLRDEILDSSGKKFAINADDLTTDSIASQISRNTQTTPEQAKAAIYDKLREAIDPADLANLTPEQQMGLQFTANPGTLQNIKGKTSDSYLKVIGRAKGKTTVDDYAAAHLYKWADNQLSTIPGYRKLNQTFTELYQANDGFRRAYDTGLRGTYIASPQDAKSRLMNTAFDIGNKQVEKVGNLQARIQAANIPNVGISTDRIGRAGQRIAPIIAAQQSSRSFGNEGDVLGMSTQEGTGDIPGQYGTQNTSTQGNVPADLNKRLAMAVLSGQLDVSTAKYLGEMLGGSGGGKQLSATQVANLADIDYAVKSLESIQDMIQSQDSQFGWADAGGRLGDMIGGPFAGGERESAKTKLQLFVSNILKAYSGTGASDEERLAFAKMLPQINDSPDVAYSKAQAAKEELASKANVMRGAFQEAGYNPYAGNNDISTQYGNNNY